MDLSLHNHSSYLTEYNDNNFIELTHAIPSVFRNYSYLSDSRVHTVINKENRVKFLEAFAFGFPMLLLENLLFHIFTLYLTCIKKKIIFFYYTD